MLAAENALELVPKQRRRTVWRVDGGAGSDDQFRWLLKRDYHVIAKGLSVRQTETLIRHLKSERKKPKVSRNRTEEIYLSGLAEDLSRHLGTKTLIKKDGHKGKVEIEFYECYFIARHAYTLTDLAVKTSHPQ